MGTLGNHCSTSCDCRVWTSEPAAPTRHSTSRVTTTCPAATARMPSASRPGHRGQRDQPEGQRRDLASDRGTPTRHRRVQLDRLGLHRRGRDSRHRIRHAPTAVRSVAGAVGRRARHRHNRPPPDSVLPQRDRLAPKGGSLPRGTTGEPRRTQADQQCLARHGLDPQLELGGLRGHTGCRRGLRRRPPRRTTPQQRRHRLETHWCGAWLPRHVHRAVRGPAS